MSESRVNLPELSVSELSSALKRTIEDAYGYVRVRGELGKVSYHSNGHVYCDLKDERASIAGVIWRGVSSKIKLKLETGLEVVVTGRLTTYPGRSQYQLVIETVEPAGVGALMALLEERKKKLAAEGLFDEARKQLLPFLPRVIGIVTSPTGAVIRDILHRLADRFPRQVVVWPVRVQGEGSAQEVAAAIRGFNALPAGGAIPVPEVIIVARGGGSLEDLWSFNEEIVVRAAADSLIPLISAVGHETDITLIDFASDRRAPTPTAAAEIAVPVRGELIAQVNSLGARAQATWQRGQDARRTELRAATRALPGADALLSIPRQRLDTAAERLPLALRANAQSHLMRYSRAAAGLNPQTLRRRVDGERERLTGLLARAARGLDVHTARRQDRFASLVARLGASLGAYRNAQQARLAHDRHRLEALSGRAQVAIAALIDRRQTRFARAGELLTALSYRGVLARGFALVRDAAGQPVRSAAAIAAGQALDIEFGDGRVGVVAQEGASSLSPEAAPAASRPARPAPAQRGRKPDSGEPGQGQLF